jgi:putative peptidoglycan lipid II flippase
MKKESLGKTFGTVAVLTVLSKVFGLVRDIVVARAYGAGPLADAYNMAYLYTGNILILFGGLGGPFHSATVSILSANKEKEDSGKLIVQVMMFTGVVLGLASLVLVIAAPYLVQSFYGDYAKNDPAQHATFVAEVIVQLRVMSPLIVIAGLIGVTYGVLNVYNKIFWPSLSPSIASLAIVVGLLIWPNRDSSLPLAIASLVGAFGQLLAQIPDMFRCPLHYKVESKPVEGLKEYGAMLWPAFIGTSIGTLTTYVDSFFTSSIPDGTGAWTAFLNANRLVQLPLGVLITAMLVPALPRFTEHFANDRISELKAEFLRALRFMWFLCMPLTVVLLILPEPIVRVLFQRGEWTKDATNLVVAALLFLVPSVIFYVGRDLITRVFYAMQDSKSPYYVAMLSIVLKALLNWIFICNMHMKVEGISLATTCMTIINLSFLTFLLRKKIGRIGISTLLKPFFIMLTASAACGAAIYYSYLGLSHVITGTGTIETLLLLTLASAVGAIVYFALCTLFKLEELQMLLNRFLKKNAKQAPAETP